ncbi:uncharacterized protein METZ01_LOCUS290465 [marine metagenome]|uniref:Uncharacterized protein n=1 Tax=marine metagenome TaxID=408172 RepID=A0A382LRT4_9ZZZZ
MAFALGAFLREDMVKMRLSTFETTLARPAETLRRTAIGFQFRHSELLAA